MPILNLPDAEIYYETCGKGIPILMIQGVGSAGTAWMPQVKELSRSHQVAVFDNRGIGKSVSRSSSISIEIMARDALAIIDHLGWESAHIVGHSMGGVIAQQLALDAPSRVRSLALMCTFSRGKEAVRISPWLIWMMLRTRVGSKGMRRRALLEMLFPKSYLEESDLDQLALKIGELVGRDLADNPRIIMRQMNAMMRHDVFHRLGEVKVPTLVLSGEHDLIASSEVGKALAKAIPGSRFIEIQAASHCCTIQKAEEVNGIYSAFIGE